jgi:4-hydroxy-4-methyl-2-oxoglutarate aldolase
MKNLNKLFVFLLSGIISTSIAQVPDKATLERGVNLISTKTYTAEDDARILELYKNLRVADVADGMDMVGLPNTGLVNESIHPDWVDLKDFAHVFRGIAVTVRYVPTQRPDGPAHGEDFEKWESSFYSKYSNESFGKVIRPGSAIVIDDVEDKDIGSIGSYNILAWHKLGAVGVVTDASSRDTDEIGLEKIPLYLRKKGRGMRPGRNEIESVNRPISIGGVLVCPGDVVVADGDGVIVVPRAVAEQVAQFATKILTKDKGARRGLYEKLNRPLDNTVK